MVHSFYKKLISLYPRGFKERLGESMEQTFNDLYMEQKQRKDRAMSGPILWMFIETAAGIFREYILLVSQGDPMKNILTNLRSPALISLLLVLPLMIMEAINRRSFNEGFPIPLFIIMWLLPMIFIIILVPVVRSLQMGNNLMAHPVNLLIRSVLLLLIVWMWTGILVDQMPCFLGVPNCD